MNKSDNGSSSNTNNSVGSDQDPEAPMCPVHNTSCVMKRVNKEGANKGRLYWSCPVAFGCHFVWCPEGTKPSAALLDPESQRRPLYSFLHTSKINQGPPYDINFQLVGSSVLQQAYKQQKDKHETLTFTNDNIDCVLMTLPKYGASTDKIVRGINDLFFKDKKVTKLSPLEFLIPLSEHETLRKFLLEVSIEGVTINVHDFPDITKMIVQHYPQLNLANIDNICRELNFHNKFPKTVLSRLRPFQKQGVAFGVQRNGRALIGDEMGLGKTLQAMSTMYYFKEDWPLLIICPSSLKHNWGREFEDWFITDERSHDTINTDKIKIISNGKQVPDNYINIISYTMAADMLAKSPVKDEDEDAILNGIRFKCVICDESHYLKNSNTKRSGAIVPFLRKAKRLIMISGTPALSRPSELFTQLNLLLDNRFTFTRSAFIHRYCDAKETQYGIDDKGSSNIMELNYLLSKTIMIRRRKDAVLTELPQKQRQRVLLSVKPSDLKQIEFSTDRMKHAAEKMKQAMSKDEHNNSKFERNSEIFKMYGMTGRAKLPAVKEYITDMIESTGDLKFLVFAYHKDVMDGIEECVAQELASYYKLKMPKDKKEYKRKMHGEYYIRIDGSTDPSRRQNLVNTFKTNDHCRVAVLSIKAAGVGYTMTPCSTVLFAELYWTPSDLRQAEDRVHRIGQKNSVHIKYLLGKDTFDEHMWPLLQKKLDVVGKSVDGESHVDENVQQVVYDRTPQFDDDDEYMDEYEDEEEGYDEELPKRKNNKVIDEEEEEEVEKPKEPQVASEVLKKFMLRPDGKLPPNVLLMGDDPSKKSLADVKSTFTFKRSFRDMMENNIPQKEAVENRPLIPVKKSFLRPALLDDDEDTIEPLTPTKKTPQTTKTSPYFKRPETLVSHSVESEPKLGSLLKLSSAFKRTDTPLAGQSTSSITKSSPMVINNQAPQTTMAATSTPQKFVLPKRNTTPSSSINPSATPQVTTSTPKVFTPPQLTRPTTSIPILPSPVGNLGKPSTSPSAPLRTSPNSSSSNNNTNVSSLLEKYSFNKPVSVSPFSQQRKQVPIFTTPTNRLLTPTREAPVPEPEQKKQKIEASIVTPQVQPKTQSETDTFEDDDFQIDDDLLPDIL